jgi:hypothetical protein
MTKQLGFDEIIEQLEGLKKQIRTELIADILTELHALADYPNAPGGIGEEARPGVLAAIELIQNEY